MHKKYDIKGSLYKRTCPSEDLNLPRKDLDFLAAKEKLHISSYERDELLETVRNDSLFFRENNIIDYSLLIGISYRHLGGAKDRGKSTPKQSFQREIFSPDRSRSYQFGIIDFLTEFK